jgi:hypothetical protein
MDETELIIKLQEHFSSVLDVPVKTGAMDDERPVPVAIIEDWTTTDFNFHNSPYAGEDSGDFDGDGVIEQEEYLSFDYETQIEFLLRTSDEVDTSRLKADTKQELRLMSDSPQDFDESIKRISLGRDGSPTYTFTEPKESEEMIVARFHGDHVITVQNGETISTVKESFPSN